MKTLFAHIQSAELTDVGLRRKNNEDSLIRLPQQGVYCVADGMGGVKGGAMASQAVVEALSNTFTQSADAPFAVTAPAAATLTRRAMNAASRWIKGRAEELGLSGTGSTVVVLLFDGMQPDRGQILHAGDSRVYRWRTGQLHQLSADHSVATAAGVNDERDLPAMFRGVITRAVGLAEEVELEETAVEVVAGDLFLLCSDGLSKMVSDKALAKLLRKNAQATLREQAEVLVAAALKAGGEDNVSVVLVSVADTLPAAPTLPVDARTLELERGDAQVVSEVRVGEDDGEIETNLTAVTGHTVDTAKFAGEGVTPPELRSSGATQDTLPQEVSPQEGATAEGAVAEGVAGATVDTPAPQEEAHDTTTAQVPSKGSREPNRGQRWLWVLLLFLAVLALGLLGYFKVGLLR